MVHAQLAVARGGQQAAAARRQPHTHIAMMTVCAAIATKTVCAGAL
jgi:hypothetical protein